MRRAHRRDTRDARVPPAGRRRRRRAADAVLRDRPRSRRLRCRRRAAGHGRAREPGLPLSRDRAVRARHRRRRSRSTTSSSPRACRSSSGATVRTTSCSSSRPRASSRDPDVLEGAGRSACWRTRAPQALVENFALAWLNLDELEAVEPDERLFPEFSDELRDDFATEIQLFLASVLLENRSVLDLLTADYTFLNERLARHYGMHGVRGPQFRRVTLEDDARCGLARQGRRAAAHLVRRPHVARAARRLGARPAHGHAADAAAAGCRDRSVDAGRARSRRRCARGSSSIARTRPATAAMA